MLWFLWKLALAKLGLVRLSKDCIGRICLKPSPPRPAPPRDFSRGMWLLWKTNVRFQINILHARFIHCHIRDNNKDLSWLVNFLYEFPQHHLQKYLWKEISQLNRSGIDPWMIIGEVNELSSFHDKMATQKGNSTRYNKFKEILN